MVPLKPIWVDMYINSCYAFTRNFKTFNNCSYCKAKHYQKGKARVQMAYFFIQDRFFIQYQDPIHVKQLYYHFEYIAKEGYNIDSTIGDVFNGIQYK